MLCDKCSAIHFKRLDDFETPRQLPQSILRTLHVSGCVFYFHHDSKEDLRASADEGCHFCEMIYGKFFRHPNPGQDRYISSTIRDEGIVLRRSIVDRWIAKKDGLAEWNSQDWIYIHCGDLLATTSILPDFKGEIAAMLQALTRPTNTTDTDCSRLVTTESGENHVSTSSSHQLTYLDSLLPSNEPIIYSPWMDVSEISPASMVLASLWLRDCLDNHRPCTERQIPGALPTRVIDVSDPDKPILASGDCRTESYLTLSYKWGTGRRYTTTSVNESVLRKAIPLQELPLTFKDAIYVTHVLGFRWLWIDALCILQDSKEDQEREMGVMDNIFRCSTMTLFAAAGDNADAGLGVDRDPRWLKPCRLGITTSLNGKTVSGSSYISIDGWGQQNSPLQTRGWCLQEEVLAMRGLIFDSFELSFRCLCGNPQESRPECRGSVQKLEETGALGYHSRREYRSGRDGFGLLRLWIMESDPVPDRTIWQRGNQYDHWYSMVTNFNKRRLTFAKDVLTALSGLANAMHKTHHCTYLSGLWQEDLQVGLAWYVTSSRYIAESDGKSPLPSWSWASQLGNSIKFRGWENNHVLIENEGCSVSATCGDSAQPHTVHCSTKTQVSALTLTARLKPALVLKGYRRISERYHNPNRTDDSEDARYRCSVLDPETQEVIGYVDLDVDMEHRHVEPIFCLLCTAREKYGQWQLTCLALTPLDDACETFARNGLVFMHKADWFGALDCWSGEREVNEYVKTVRVV